MALPEGLQFLQLGWWVVHAIAVLFVYQYGFVRGRAAARREQRVRDLEAGKP
jgi:hypothetical protein